MRVLVPLGTRPEIVKLSPVVAALRKAGHEVRTLATGQHFDPRLADDFFADLELQPDVRWSLTGGEGERVGTILSCAFAELDEHAADLVLLLGDTYTVPLFCLAARRHRVPVAHLEAGLRSFNETSMEEVNRKVAAATASLHLAPTELAARFLLDEGVDARRVHVVGNPIVDVLRRLDARPLPIDERDRVVVTAHRATNVDDPERLRALVDLVRRLAAEVAPVVFPAHPRTTQRLADAGLLGPLRDAPGIDVVEPVPYDEMLGLLARARVVVTDSGGLQEEASWLGVPVVVLRRSTPRWEGVAAGTSVLVGMDVDRALDAARRLATADDLRRIGEVPCPYGDGDTGERVADLLADAGVLDLLRIEEPDLVDATPWVRP